MAWIGASILGVLLSVFVVLLVVSAGFRTFVFGAVCVLGVAGVLLYLYQQPTTPEQTREQHADARSRAQAPGAGKEPAVSWVPRAGRPGTPGAPTAQERPEAVSTPAEAAQAVQRFRAVQDVRGSQEEQPAFAVPPADVRPPPQTIAPHLATPVPAPARQAALASEEHDAAARAAATTALAPLTALAASTPSAPTMDRALKSCDALQAEIQAKLEAKGLTGYALTIMTSGDLQGLHVVGRCEGNTKKIILNRSRNAP